MNEQSTQNETLILALQALGHATEPLGAGSLARALRDMGSPVSMATAGRILWELDEKGYVEKVSNKGRVLSTEGQAYLEEVEARGKNNMLAQALLDELHLRTPGDLLDILVARRAIERETARLAAVNASEEDLAEIRAFAEILDGGEEQGRSISVMDRMFHEAIAQAGKNSVLIATLKLVRQDVHVQHAFAFIRRQEGRHLGGDHMPVYEAVAGRDPDAAERAMLRHIDNIVRDVEHYCREEDLAGDSSER
ncbi:MAG: FCD domain-containing protein [Synergistales bacterium]|nr:FCD domain-containing protein [Synergistales bacterium]